MPEQDWSGFLENLPPITVLSFGNDAVRKSHRLSDILLANLFAYKQYARSERFTVVIDEIEDMWLDEKAPLGMILRKDPFGGMRIDKIKTSDAKLWLIKLQREDGKDYSSIHTIRGVLRPAFQMAEEDDLIRKNPFGFELCTVVENDSVKREAITEQQEQEYLDFIRSDKQYRQYYDAIFILFNTGLRISEFCGLTVSDIDFENRCIHVARQLIRTSAGKYTTEKPKTQAGIRSVSMTAEVEEAFARIIRNRRRARREPMIDGCKLHPDAHGALKNTGSNLLGNQKVDGTPSFTWYPQMTRSLSKCTCPEETATMHHKEEPQSNTKAAVTRAFRF